ncbi:hypothetical protein [Pontixanthobacter luteolus]|uniref:hypothetical protein n=1 Tax=Pontixanthobacter luteolus TaxID=295089 RepID=UPI002303DCF6|nr:hypothetical protein [Pontixanthobacter luteolus]
MRKIILAAAAVIAIPVLSAPANAGWRKIEPVETTVAKGAMEVAPSSEWNRWSRRPAKKGETWTKDGLPLNQLDFFGQVANGDPVYKERNKSDRPLPKFKSDMLLPDLATLFEANFSIENNITQFEVTEIAPAMLGGANGLKLTYDYALPGESLQRRGEARMAVHNGELYVVNFTAPRLHFFDQNIEEVRGIMDRIKLM